MRFMFLLIYLWWKIKSNAYVSFMVNNAAFTTNILFLQFMGGGKVQPFGHILQFLFYEKTSKYLVLLSIRSVNFTFHQREPGMFVFFFFFSRCRTFVCVIILMFIIDIVLQEWMSFRNSFCGILIFFKEWCKLIVTKRALICKCSVDSESFKSV